MEFPCLLSVAELSTLGLCRECIDLHVCCVIEKEIINFRKTLRLTLGNIDMFHEQLKVQLFS